MSARFGGASIARARRADARGFATPVGASACGGTPSWRRASGGDNPTACSRVAARRGGPAVRDRAASCRVSTGRDRTAATARPARGNASAAGVSTVCGVAALEAPVGLSEVELHVIELEVLRPRLEFDDLRARDERDRREARVGLPMTKVRVHLIVGKDGGPSREHGAIREDLEPHVAVSALAPRRTIAARPRRAERVRSRGLYVHREVEPVPVLNGTDRKLGSRSRWIECPIEGGGGLVPKFTHGAGTQ